MSPHWTIAAIQIFAAASLRVTLVAALVAAILVVSRVRASSFRHAAWTTVLVAMILMPALPSVVPSISIPARWLNAPRASEPIIDVAGAPHWPSDSVPSSGEAPVARPISAAPAESTAQSPPRAVPWPVLLVGIYALGVLASLVNIWFGLRSLGRLLGTSRPVDRGALESAGARLPIEAAAVCESRAVASPLTTGMLRPRIVLPATWRSWPAEKLRAVLAHETSHVRRRDTLIAFIARLNRAVFWFHPLAWWLERRLRSMAEYACDAAAIREVGETRRYAAILVDLANEVRRTGRRVAWTSVGVGGRGDIGRRVERVLRGEVSLEVSKTRKLVVGCCCAAAILVVVACRKEAPPPAPLQPDPEVAADLERQRAQSAEFKVAEIMTAQQVSELEVSLKKNPENLDARRKLQVFYRFSGAKVVGWDKTVAARRTHILWLIEHHPGDVVTTEWGPINPKYDPDGYATAKKRWLAEIAKPGVEAAVLSNAAYFFTPSDRPLAEECLLRAQALDPGGPKPRERDGNYYPSWSTRLGWLYAGGAVGSTDQLYFVAHTLNAEQSRSRFAQDARIKLAQSNDVVMLTAAGQMLTMDVNLAASGSLDFDPVALGRTCLERALRLDPKAVNSRILLARLEAAERQRRIRGLLAGATGERLDEALARLSDADRLAYLPFLVESEYARAEFLEVSKRDDDGMKAGFGRARKLAHDLLALADKSIQDENAGNGLFSGHVALACFALRDNDKATAMRHMKDAVGASSTGSLPYRPTTGLWPELAGRMLGWAERDSVIEFLEQYARMSLDSRDRLLKDASAIRAGRMPSFYQYQVTPR